MSALSRGGATGTPGRLDLSTISTADLDAAALKSISTSAGKGSSTRVRKLKTLVGLIRPLRSAQRAHDWPEAESIVDTLVLGMKEFGDAIDVCRREVELAIGDVEHRRLVAQLRAGLTSGAIARQTPQVPPPSEPVHCGINFSAVSCETLEAALESHRNVSPLLKVNMPSTTVQLMDTCKTVVELRRAVLSNDWASASAVAQKLRQGFDVCLSTSVWCFTSTLCNIIPLFVAVWS